MVKTYCREIKFCDKKYYFPILGRFQFRMGAELPKNLAGSKNESLLGMEKIFLMTKFNFAAIGGKDFFYP